ncbi:MAG: signal peptidase I [Gaiellaceae bacterium]
MRRLVAAAALAVLLAAPVLAIAADDPTHAQAEAELARIHITPRATDHTLTIFAGSMEPTLRCAKPGISCSAAVADHVLARPLPFSAIHRGAIVVMATTNLATTQCGNGPLLVKRVVGLPGDVVAERNGRLFVNGKAATEPYVKRENRDSRTIAPKRVPPRTLYVLGDNRVSSCDSRVWGMLPAANVLARAIAIYWPHARTRRL